MGGNGEGGLSVGELERVCLFVCVSASLRERKSRERELIGSNINVTVIRYFVAVPVRKRI